MKKNRNSHVSSRLQLGAVLQCDALNKTLEQLGGSPSTIDYFPSYFSTPQKAL